MINVQRLRLLRELSFLGTISAVADSMDLTRPAVSQQLSQLEKDTGLVLVERAGRSVRLTGAGLRLVEQSHEIFESLERIDAAIAVSKASISGDVRISAFPSFSATVLPGAIAALRSSQPQLKVYMVEHEPAEAMGDLMTKRADVAILDNLSRQDPRNEAVLYQSLFGDDFYVVMSEKHPYRKLDTVPLKYLATEDWALNRSAQIYHSSIVEACLAEGFRPNVTCDCKDTATVLQMVRAGLAVSVLPGLALIGPSHGLAIRPLEPLMKREVLFATLKGRSGHPAILECFRAIRSSYAHNVQPSYRIFSEPAPASEH